MFVAASTRCFPDVSLGKCLKKLADLEYRSAEIVIGNKLSDLQPEWLTEDFQAAARLCVSCRQISPVAFFIDLPFDSQLYFSTFELVLKLCKTLGVVVVVVKSAPLGSPFNEEFERLSRLVQLGSAYGVLVSLLTEQGATSEAIDSLNSLCKGIPNLRIALDPSHFIYGRRVQTDFDSIIPKTVHLRLRDTTPQKFQVKIGQGSLEYKKLVDQLNRRSYSRALCVDLGALPDVEPESELRKMRLLMESLL